MRLMGKTVVGAALMVLAGCTSASDGKDSAQATGRNGAGVDGRFDRLAADDPKATLAAAGINDTVYFDYDKTTLRPDTLPALLRVAEWMRRYPDVQIRIAGHADERGTREYNLALGDRRAASVRAYLVSQGIAAQRLETVSYGKEHPVAVGSDEASWAKNRRAVAEVE